MKKLILNLICFLTLIIFIPTVSAAEENNAKEPVNVYMFTREACSHCEEAEEYFAELSTDEEYGDLFRLNILEVYDVSWNIVNEDYYDILMELSRYETVHYSGTPYIIVGEEVFDGFTSSYDKAIKAEIKRCYDDGYLDPVVNLDILKDRKNDEDKGIKIFINIVAITIVVGVVASLIVINLPKKKTNKLEPKSKLKNNKN